MAADLLPCPFCGGEAHTWTTSNRDESSSGAYCGKCLAEGDVYGTTPEAIAAWNRRAPPLAAPAPSAMATGEFKAMADEVAKRIATEAALQRRIAWLETKVRMFDTFASAQACKSVDNAMQSRFGDSATSQDAADCATPPAAPAAVTEDKR